MTVQQLKYLTVIAEKGSITAAAAALYLSQPSLSEVIRSAEREMGLLLFTRSRTGVVPTKDGLEFLGYARQVLEQMELLESRYTAAPPKQRFCVSTQHYTFAANAFVELVQQFGQDRYEFMLNETQTHQVIEDVHNRLSDLGILYLSGENEAVLQKTIDAYSLRFFPLFSAVPHAFLRSDHPLAKHSALTLADLAPYPRLRFVQGLYQSATFSEEPFSGEPSARSIHVSDRAAIVNLMIGLNGYTISSGIFPSYLQGSAIISIPLQTEERMPIGYLLNQDRELSPLGQTYVQALLRYTPPSR